MRKRPRGGPWVFDESFKRMAVELSETKGSVSVAPAELGPTESAVNYYRQSFGNYSLIDPALQKIGASFSDGKPFSVPTLYFHGQNDG